MHLLYATDRHVDTYLVKALREAGHMVETANQLGDGLEMASAGQYQAIMLDWTVPRISCAARFVRAANQALLIVIIAKGDETDRASILEAGADACCLRPVAFIELEARLEALARLVQRSQSPGEPIVFEMAPARQAVRLNGRTIALSSREYRLMEHLTAHVGEVVGLEGLGRHVWGEDAEPRPELVRTHVARLRRKLDADGAGAVLRNVPGHGYILQPIALDPSHTPDG